VLKPGQLSGSWLYAGGHGTLCSPAQVVLVLVAGLMPEEVTDEAAAEQLAQVQDRLLRELAAAHPQALFYSNFFRCACSAMWGLQCPAGSTLHCLPSSCQLTLRMTVVCRLRT
jgi:hypothetical protein